MFGFGKKAQTEVLQKIESNRVLIEQEIAEIDSLYEKVMPSAVPIKPKANGNGNGTAPSNGNGNGNGKGKPLSVEEMKSKIQKTASQVGIMSSIAIRSDVRKMHRKTS